MLAGLAALVVVGLSVAGYFWARPGQGPEIAVGYVPTQPRTGPDLTRVLIAAGIDAASVVLPLEPSDDIRALAASIRVEGPEARLRAAVEVIAAKVRQGSIVAAELRFSGGPPPRTAAELARLSQGSSPLKASSFELALLTTAVARAASVPALVGEGLAQLIERDGGMRGRAPALEPFGTRGVFVSALAPVTAAARPIAARAGGEVPAEVDVRSDEAVCQLFFAQRALALLDTDPAAAALDADRAARFAEASPTVTSARAAVAETVDVPGAAVSIWRSAIAQGGNDAPRLAALASQLLAAGDVGDAAAEAREALALDPDQATAHAALSRALAQIGEVDAAEGELTLARKGSARGLALAEAAVAFARRDPKQGRARLEQALNDDDHALEAALTLYELLVSEGDQNAAAKLREQALSRSKLPERLKLRFAEIDQTYAAPPVPPDAGSPQNPVDAGKPKYVIPDGLGTPI